MAPASLLRLAIIASIINVICEAQTIITSETSGNSTHKYFIASEYNGSDFKSSTIECTSKYCYIVCDIDGGCTDLQVYTQSLTDNLIIECIENEACQYAIINAATTTNIDLLCTIKPNSTLGNNYGPCAYLSMDASKSTTVNIQCIGKHSCYDSNFNLSDTESATFISDEAYSTQDSKLYAYNMENQLNISCGNYSCYSLEIYADFMTGPLSLNCNEYWGCYNTILYATKMRSEYVFLIESSPHKQIFF